VPVAPEYYATRGLESLTATIQKIKRTLNPRLKIYSILLTPPTGHGSFYNDMREFVKEEIGKDLPVFDTLIPGSVKAAEAPQIQLSIFSHSKNNSVAMAYADVATEMINKEKAKEEMER
jgi:chromosome partitioning protein